MLALFAVSGLINAITALTFGALVIAKNWRDRGNRLFFLMTVALAAWGFAYWFWLSAISADSALLWLRILSIASVFIPLFFFHWITILLSPRKFTHLILVAAYTMSLGIILFAFSPLFVISMSQKLFFPFWPDAGILYALYIAILYLGLIAVAIGMLTQTWRTNTDPELRGRIAYILLGTIIGFGGGLTDFFLWFDIYIPPYGNFLVAAFPFLLGYAALKHRLFSLKTIAAELLVFFICVILLVQTAFSNSSEEIILRALFFAVVSAAGVLLIRSVYREVEQREQIEKLSEEKSEFMSFASHEIRNPITAMRGYASLISDGTTGGISVATKDAADMILMTGNQVLVLIAQFLDKSKLELGQIQYAKEKFDLGKATAAVVDGFVPSAMQHRLKLEKQLNYDGLIVEADEAKLKDVVGNLIDNSIKYTPQGGIMVTVSKHNGMGRITIADTGAGIPKAVLPHLFQKFSRADAKKMNLRGTGLGLYLAKQFIEAMGGKIWAESPGEGLGSKFMIELPAV